MKAEYKSKKSMRLNEHHTYGPFFAKIHGTERKDDPMFELPTMNHSHPKSGGTKKRDIPSIKACITYLKALKTECETDELAVKWALAEDEAHLEMLENQKLTCTML